MLNENSSKGSNDSNLITGPRSLKKLECDEDWGSGSELGSEEDYWDLNLHSKSKVLASKAKFLVLIILLI